MSVKLKAGDLVSFRDGGGVGIVSRPIAEQGSGHVLALRDDGIIGIAASLEDVAPADESHDGFAQLAYQLIKLGSHVIERRLIGITESQFLPPIGR